MGVPCCSCVSALAHYDDEDGAAAAVFWLWLTGAGVSCFHSFPASILSIFPFFHSFSHSSSAAAYQAERLML